MTDQQYQLRTKGVYNLQTKRKAKIVPRDVKSICYRQWIAIPNIRTVQHIMQNKTLILMRPNVLSTIVVFLLYPLRPNTIESNWVHLCPWWQQLSSMCAYVGTEVRTERPTVTPTVFTMARAYYTLNKLLHE